MTFRIVFVGLAVFFVARGLVRAVAEGLVFGKAAHANPDRFLLRFDFKRPLVRLQNFAHGDQITVSQVRRNRSHVWAERDKMLCAFPLKDSHAVSQIPGVASSIM